MRLLVRVSAVCACVFPQPFFPVAKAKAGKKSNVREVESDEDIDFNLECREEDCRGKVLGLVWKY